MACSHRNSIMHSSLGKQNSIDRDKNERISSLWIWNSGEVRDMLGEDTDDELDWDNFREISGAASAARGEDDLAFDDDSFVEEISLNDRTEGQYEIEDIPDDTTRINHQMSALMSSFIPDDRSVGRSVDTTTSAQSVDTLSYHDDIVATFNDNAVTQEIISKAVSDALARARQAFDNRQKARQRKDTISPERSESDDSAAASAEYDDEEEARRIVLEDSGMNHITAHTTASMVSSEFHSSDLESFDEFDDQESDESEESDIFSEKTVTTTAQEEDLNSIVSSDFHSSDLESFDAKEDDRGYETDGLRGKGISESPQDEDWNNSVSTEAIHDASGTYYFEISEDYVPVGGRDLHSTNTELTESIVSSAALDINDMHLDDDSASDCIEYTVELRRPPLHHSISGLTCFSAALQPELSSPSLHSPASKRARRPIDHPSPKTWKRVEANPRFNPIPPKPPTRIQSEPPPSTLPLGYQKPSVKASPIPSTKHQFLDMDLSPRWSKVAASFRKTIAGKQSKKQGKKKNIPEARSMSSDLDMDTVPAVPVVSPSTTNRSTPAGKPNVLASSATKERNRANLDQLNSKMNSAIGVQMSPGSLAKTRKMSLSQRRESLKTLRERLRESFNHAVSPILES
jgi:hypothetical protein